MGYYTYLQLDTYGDKKDIEEMEKAASELKDDDDDCVADGIEWKEGIKELVQETYLEAKWYSFQTDFVAWAKRFPKVLFIVDGDGEDSDDVWQLRVKGDEVEYREMQFPPLQNLNLLTEDEKIRSILSQE